MARSFVFGLGIAILVAACGSRSGLVYDRADAGVYDGGPPKLTKTDKVDLLLMIDNSVSMGDKQELLAEAIPDLVARFMTPYCTKPGDLEGYAQPPLNGVCPSGTQPEINPVVDLHVGILTSSLGGGGSPDVCPADAKNPIPQLNKFNRHNDDRAQLINRKRPSLTSPPANGVEDPVPRAAPLDGQGGGGFLAWLPATDVNKGKPAPNVQLEPTQDELSKDFQELVKGVQEYGCGLEGQLESIYRFLIQPDPYDALVLDTTCAQCNPAKAQLIGVDATILKQRKDFLRPDSAVIVILLTDEEDSWSDPLTLAGRGWATRTNVFPGSPTGLMPRGTSYCSQPIDVNDTEHTGPNDPNCTSCGFAGNLANGLAIADDPSCQTSCGGVCHGYYTAKEDNINVRYTNDMKRRYGFDPQFPVARYKDGFLSRQVPNREGEHPGATGPYKGTKNCQNPLYAASLPTDPNADLCHLADGPRADALVYFFLISGVPWQLLTTNPDNPTAPFKGHLDDADWRKLLGADPEHYRTDGIDPHMVESTTPRLGLPGPGTVDNADPYNGREWNTTLAPAGLDLQYACTFQLPNPKDCTLAENKSACDCVGNAMQAGGPPLCTANINDGGQKSLQVRGKAYPGIRQLRVAKQMGDRAVVASICPQSLQVGYRPAMGELMRRLRPALPPPQH